MVERTMVELSQEGNAGRTGSNFLDTACDFFQHMIANSVPERVIHILEAIQVHDEDGHACIRRVKGKRRDSTS